MTELKTFSPFFKSTLLEIYKKNIAEILKVEPENADIKILLDTFRQTCMDHERRFDKNLVVIDHIWTLHDTAIDMINCPYIPTKPGQPLKNPVLDLVKKLQISALTYLYLDSSSNDSKLSHIPDGLYELSRISHALTYTPINDGLFGCAKLILDGFLISKQLHEDVEEQVKKILEDFNSKLVPLAKGEVKELKVQINEFAEGSKEDHFSILEIGSIHDELETQSDLAITGSYIQKVE